jgi:membrane protein YqaA with SNARE-associated domain
VTDLPILFLIVFAIHLAPAFTPPTWPVIVLYSLNTALPMPLLVVSAGLAAALGRYVLARLSRLLVHRFPAKIRRNLEAAQQLIERRRSGQALGLTLFVFTPLPSAQLFEAAGLAGVRLWPCVLAYFLGRLGFYTSYAFAARQVQASGFADKLASPGAIAIQVLVIVVLVLLIRTDWSRWLGPRP